jgi:hypothetical protein
MILSGDSEKAKEVIDEFYRNMDNDSIAKEEQ